MRAVSSPVLEELEHRQLFAALTIQVTTGADEANGQAVAGSLRAAIITANANPGSTIDFTNLPALTPIILDASLPAITAATTEIDGTSGPNGQVVIDGNPALPTNAAGAGTGFTGLDIKAAGATIQGLWLQYFNQAIILDTGSGTATITDNYIGDVNDTGSGANQVGIEITNGSNNNNIDNSQGSGNVISGNISTSASFTGTAIIIEDPSNLGTTLNTIVGNTIGLNPTQTAVAPNGRGIVLSDVHGNTIEENQIGGSSYAFGPSTGNGTATSPRGGGAGIVTLSQNGAEYGNTIEYNSIGIPANGFGGATAAIPNQIGVYISNFATATQGDTFTGNTVEANTGAGFDVLGSGNTISNNPIQSNGGTGILVASTAERDTFSQNNIDLNGATADGDYNLGIDLGGDGITPNAANGGTTAIGANGLTQFPVITATSNIVTYTVGISYRGNPNTQYNIEIFTNPAAVASPSGYGQGETYVSTVTLTTNSLGIGTATTTLDVNELYDDISATATNASAYNVSTNPDAGATSEFAKNITVGGLSGSSLDINLQIGNGATLNEGSTTLDKTDAYFTSTGTGPYTATVDFGDNSGLQLVPISATGQLTLTHTYNGHLSHTYVARVIVYDANTDSAAAHTFDVTVVAPGPYDLTVKSKTRAAVTTASLFRATAKFLDAGASNGDLFRVSVDYGDGTKVFRATTQHNTFSLAHHYTHMGRYKLVVTVIDDGGGETTYAQAVNVFAPPAKKKA